MTWIIDYIHVKQQKIYLNKTGDKPLPEAKIAHLADTYMYHQALVYYWGIIWTNDILLVSFQWVIVRKHNSSALTMELCLSLL